MLLLELSEEEIMIALILIFAASASASIEANPDPKMIKVIQEQTADVAERSLIILLNDTVGICMMNKYCKVAAAPKARIPVDSIASGLAMSFEVIKKALENNKGRQLPNLMKIKTAFDLGRKTKEEELCESVFPCGKEINLPTEDEVMARVAVPECSELNMVCPGVRNSIFIQSHP